MFTSKKSQLFETQSKSSKTTTSGSTNPFVSAGLKKGAQTSSQNGALKYSTTGNDFVDQFGVIGTYKTPRSFNLISKDQEILWSQNKLMTVAFSLYLRMITRITDVFGTKTTVSQNGAEMRHEGIMRMLWLSLNEPKTFWKNVTLTVAVGSWKDIFTMLQYDLMYHGWNDRKLNWDKFGKLILAGLNDENQNNLVKKYLPQIKANSACKTVESQADNIISKWICSLLFGSKTGSEVSTYKMYRKLKTSGNAHEWQKLISQGKHNLIDFNTIHGRALNKLVRSKYLDNQGLKEKYESWITKDSVEAKFTGFVHELFENLPAHKSSLGVAKEETINKQFDTLVKKGGEIKKETQLIVVRDTSSSMSSQATGTKLSCFEVGKALALYFSKFLTGKFADAWIEFDNKAEMRQWTGTKALDCWYNERNSRPYGSTNFQGVFDLFANLKAQGVSESDFPTGILCISDSEFNPASLGKTNVDAALNKLRSAGFSKDYVNNFTIVLWNLQNRSGGGNKFETYGDVKNVYYFSGYSPATLSFLTENIKNAKELFEAAMNQEVLSLIEL